MHVGEIKEFLYNIQGILKRYLVTFDNILKRLPLIRGFEYMMVLELVKILISRSEEVMMEDITLDQKRKADKKLML